jgi:glycine cleavage system aminomethyltransferase T
MDYTYTIFDANPNEAGMCALPHLQNIELEAEDDEEAIAYIIEEMRCEVDPGERLWAHVWNANGVIVGSPVIDGEEE